MERVRFDPYGLFMIDAILGSATILAELLKTVLINLRLSNKRTTIQVQRIILSSLRDGLPIAIDIVLLKLWIR